MAFMFLLILATIGVPFSIFVGLILLAFPRSRPLSLYAFTVYPSAYFVGLLCFFLIGFVGHMVANLSDNPVTTQHPVLSLAAYGIVGLVARGSGVVGAMAGAFFGFVIANRLWWRFFASSDARTGCFRPQNWIAFPTSLRSLMRSSQKK